MKNNIYDKLQFPENQWGTSITQSEGEYVATFLGEQKITKTLEIGLAYGCSTAYIISATQSLHYAIDPFQSEWNNLGLKNLQSLGFDHLLNLEEDYAHNVLPKLIKENKKFDFIFIDGDHKFDSVFIDFYFSDLLLNHDGYILLHDYWMPSIKMCVSWINNNKEDYKPIETPIPNLKMFQKKDVDNRVWTHFKTFSPS